MKSRANHVVPLWSVFLAFSVVCQPKVQYLMLSICCTGKRDRDIRGRLWEKLRYACSLDYRCASVLIGVLQNIESIHSHGAWGPHGAWDPLALLSLTVL